MCFAFDKYILYSSNLFRHLSNNKAPVNWVIGWASEASEKNKKLPPTPQLLKNKTIFYEYVSMPVTKIEVKRNNQFQKNFHTGWWDMVYKGRKSEAPVRVKNRLTYEAC